MHVSSIPSRGCDMSVPVAYILWRGSETVRVAYFGEGSMMLIQAAYSTMAKEARCVCK